MILDLNLRRFTHLLENINVQETFDIIHTLKKRITDNQQPVPPGLKESRSSISPVPPRGRHQSQCNTFEKCYVSSYLLVIYSDL